LFSPHYLDISPRPQGGIEPTNSSGCTSYWQGNVHVSLEADSRNTRNLCYAQINECVVYWRELPTWCNNYDLLS